MFCLRNLRFAVGLMTLPLAAQTQVDLHSQSKGVDFQNAPYTRPIRTATVLPATCTVSELILVTSAPPGANIYACLSANTWVPETGGTAQSPTIQNGGVSVAARGTENFVPGAGLTNAITDLGTRINIQQSVDSSIVVTQASLQAGQAQFCPSASGSSATYTCSVTPALTSYTPGMILHWKPDLNGAGGATTLNVDLLGAVPLIRQDGTNPGNSDIVAGELYQVWYDGTVFRLLSGTVTSGGSSGGSGLLPGLITATNAGGQTVIVASGEWHSMPAFCSGASTATLVWNTPPAAATPATAGGCQGSNVNEAGAVFANTGTPSLQTSFALPQALTGNADVYIHYLSGTASGTFALAMDLVCSQSGVDNEDPAFSANNFFAPGPSIAPPSAGTLGVISATGLRWPTGCTGGSRAHLRLIRTDSGGTAQSISVPEVVIVLRRML